MDEQVKIRWNFRPDEDGWPPVDSEDLWGVLIGEGVARVDSIPWFVEDISLGDIIKVLPYTDDVFRPAEKLKWSGNCTVRIIPLDLDSSAFPRRVEEIVETFVNLGARGEALPRYNIIALSIPSEANIPQIKRLLNDGEENESWTYEEGCIGPAWAAIDATH